MEYENALNFLLYSYFGIDGGVRQLEEEKNHKSIVVLCAHRAYLDLARTVKFKYTSSQLESMSSRNSTEDKKAEAKEYKESKKQCIDSICEYICDCADKIPCRDVEFTEWHNNTCAEIIRKINQATYKTIISENNKIIEVDFTYGQAQKWLNMTLKYLWLLGLLPKDFDNNLLHVPIDSYIIEAAKANKEELPDGLGIDKNKSETSWSAWNDSEYEEYQKAIKAAIDNDTKFGSPIEWEGKAWIEIAKKHA
ncbi:MAG: hypothetical protein ACI4SB_06945 [Acutalibacteraceae bacterium]